MQLATHPTLATGRTSKVSELNWGHDRLQQECYTWLWNKYPQTRRTCWHTPNEYSNDTWFQVQVGKLFPNAKWLLSLAKEAKQRTIIFMTRRKAIGVLAGVTDLTWFWNGKLYMFDIKLGSDSLSQAQLEFIAANTKQGGVFHEISSLSQFQTIVAEIMEV